MPRIDSNPTPSVLIWARTSAGLSPDQAAKKIEVSAERLLSWESGTEKPTIAQLRKAGTAYKRPIAVFYLKGPPKGFAVMRDFRRRPGSDSGTVSTALVQEIRRAHDRRGWALELMAALGEKPKTINQRISLSQDVELAATLLRSFLGVTIEAQSGWRDQSFNHWRSKTENAGILTFEMTMVSSDEASGFSIGHRPLPAVVVNIKDSARARVFTLLHEIAHILLGEEGICDLDESGNDEAARVETFCNNVAGASIFPKEDLLAFETVRRHSRNHAQWTDEELRALSSYFGASREAALVRLARLGLTTRAFCDSRRAQFQYEYARTAQAKKEQAAEGFAPPHQLALWSAGPLFVSLVIENLNRDRISASDFSDYLQIRTKHIPEVQQEYAGFGQ